MLLDRSESSAINLAFGFALWHDLFVFTDDAPPFKDRHCGVPGEAFFQGAGSSSLIRFCFAKEDGELEEACGKLGKLGIRLRF